MGGSKRGVLQKDRGNELEDEGHLDHLQIPGLNGLFLLIIFHVFMQEMGLNEA